MPISQSKCLILALFVYLSSPGLNSVILDNRYHRAGYQLALLTLAFLKEAELLITSNVIRTTSGVQ